MKKYLISFICFNIVSLPAFSLINDEFVDSTLDKSKPYPIHVIKNINDEFVDGNLGEIALPIRKKSYYKDEFAENNKSKNSVLNERPVINEILPKSNCKNTIYEKRNIIFDKSNMVPVEIRIKSKICSKFKKIDEGDYVEFETINPVEIENKTYPSGTIVKGRIETISPNEAKGVAGELVVSNFEINNIKLYGDISKTGANRTLWLYPTSIIFSAFFGLGVVLLFIRGGHAKIKPTQVYTIYAKN